MLNSFPFAVQDYITELDDADLLDSLVYGTYDNANLSADATGAIYLDVRVSS